MPSRYGGGSSPGSQVARSAALARATTRARGGWTWCPGMAAVLLLKAVGGLERLQVWITLPCALVANAMAAAARRPSSPPDLVVASLAESQPASVLCYCVFLGSCVGVRFKPWIWN